MRRRSPGDRRPGATRSSVGAAACERPRRHAGQQQDEVLVPLADGFHLRREIALPVDRQVGEGDVVGPQDIFEKARAVRLEGEPEVDSARSTGAPPRPKRRYSSTSPGESPSWKSRQPSASTRYITFGGVSLLPWRVRIAVRLTPCICLATRDPAGPSIGTTRGASRAQSVAAPRIASTASAGATRTASRRLSRKRSATRASKWSGWLCVTRARPTPSNGAVPATIFSIVSADGAR